MTRTALRSPGSPRSARPLARRRRRAIYDADKEARRADILNAARKLFAKSGGQLATVSDVAQAAGLAKGTVYLYFRTKEELYLALYEEFVTALLTRMQAAAAHASAAASIVNAMCSFVAERPELMRLASLANSVLEQNVSEEFVLGYKTRITATLLATANRLVEVLPDASFDGVARLLLQTYAFSVGLWQQADLPAVVRALMRKHPELSVLRIDFARELRCGLDLLWSVPRSEA